MRAPKRARTWSAQVYAVQTRYEGACDSAFISPVATVPLHFIVNLSWEKIYVITPYTLLSLAYWRYFSFVFFIHVFSHMLFVLLIYSLFKGLHWVKKKTFLKSIHIEMLCKNFCTDQTLYEFWFTLNFLKCANFNARTFVRPWHLFVEMDWRKDYLFLNQPCGQFLTSSHDDLSYLFH